jgi:hypothetical protein
MVLLSGYPESMKIEFQNSIQKTERLPFKQTHGVGLTIVMSTMRMSRNGGVA